MNILKQDMGITLYEDDNGLHLYIQEQPVLENYPKDMIFRSAIEKSFNNLVKIQKEKQKKNK